jgi:hypothetical protein
MDRIRSAWTSAGTSAGRLEKSTGNARETGKTDCDLCRGCEEISLFHLSVLPA